MEMILVTGAGGGVGGELLAQLREAGHSARGGYHSGQRALQAGDDAVVIDLDRPASLAAQLDGVDSLFLIAGMGPRQTQQELAAVAAAGQAGVRHVVKLSVWRADELLTPIARIHRPIEEALEASGIGWTFLRPNFYMQNFARQMATSIATAGEIAQPASWAPISFVDTRDVARVAAAVLTDDGHDGRVYSPTGPQALTFERVAQTFAAVLDQPCSFVELSDEEARARMLARGLPDFYTDALIEVSRAYREGGAETVTDTVEQLTGRRATSLSTFVRDYRHLFAAGG
jgi:uncharacterized protein YbjT (DUF2867 family)